MIILKDFAETESIPNPEIRMEMFKLWIEMAGSVANQSVAVLACIHEQLGMQVTVSFHIGYKETRDITPEEELILIPILAQATGCTTIQQ